MPHLLTFRFDEQEVEFDITGADVLVNATEMAKIFGKEPYAFLRLEQTKRFMAEMESAFPAFRTGAETVLNAGNALSEEENSLRTVDAPAELVRTERGKSVDGGVTWMHRLLALKFAAWLDARFEVWVYGTIEQVLFAHGQRMGEEVREKARLLDRRDELRQQLRDNALFQEHELIEYKLRQVGHRMARHNTSQLQLFRQPA